MGRRPRYRIVPRIDSLEGRQLLSATTSLDHGILTIRGDRTNDVITVSENRGRVEVHGTTRRGAAVSFAARDVHRIVFVGDAGDDRFTDNTSIPATAFGGAGNDRLVGGGGRDDLRGDAGNDVLSGRSGNDHLNGGLGDDRLFGDDGNDLLDDHSGRDQFAGGRGADNVAGGVDRDGGDPGDRNDDRGRGRGRDDATIIAAPPAQTPVVVDTNHTDDRGGGKRRDG